MSATNKSTNESNRAIEQKITELAKPYQSAEVLEYLYWDEELSQRAIGERLGCSEKTIRRWMGRLGVERRDHRVERANYYVGPKGYSRWVSREGDGTPTVYVHQLAAVANGTDPHEIWNDDTDTVCHHACPVPWLNIGSLIEVLSAGEHRRTHEENAWTEEDGIPVLVSQTDS